MIKLATAEEAAEEIEDGADVSLAQPTAVEEETEEEEESDGQSSEEEDDGDDDESAYEETVFDDEGMEDFWESYSQHHMDVRPTKGRSNFYDYLNGGFDEDELTEFRTAADFGQKAAQSLDDAVMQARSTVQSVGTVNSGHGNVPIRPMGVAEKRAATIAQSMIERMSTVEDDETRMQDEFKYNTKRLLKLQLNPMRGIQSAKVGRSKAPISIFLDYSGSCGHVTNLFGLIMVGFANEGATVLIGGNGVVNAVYHPFPNRPLAFYAEDMGRLQNMDVDDSVRTKAGFIVTCRGANLHDLTVGPLIACTDFDSYIALMKRPRHSTHVILALEGVHCRNIRSVMQQGRLDFGTADLATWFATHATSLQKKTHSSLYSQGQNLSLHQTVWPVYNLETLTTMMRSGR